MRALVLIVVVMLAGCGPSAQFTTERDDMVDRFNNDLQNLLHGVPIVKYETKAFINKNSMGRYAKAGGHIQSANERVRIDGEYVEVGSEWKLARITLLGGKGFHEKVYDKELAERFHQMAITPYGK